MTTNEKTNSTVRKTIGTVVVAITLAVMPAVRMDAQVNNTYTERSSISLIQKKLSESQLSTFFGIGNPVPGDPKTVARYGVGKGWQGPGIYVFSDNRTTCYLDIVRELNNWYFAKFVKERDAPEQNGALQPADPEVEKLVRSAHSKTGSVLRGMVGIAETPARVIGGIKPVGASKQEGPVVVGANTPGVTVGGVGGVAPTQKKEETNAPISAQTQQTTPSTTVIAPGKLVENITNIFSPDQQKLYFGLGNMLPFGGKTYPQSKGWQGPGIYEFTDLKFNTAPLTSQEQLGNWYFLLYGQRERANELAGKPIDPSVISGVDAARR